MKEAIQQWFAENGKRLWMFLGILVVGALCFEAGLLYGKLDQGKTLTITVPPLPVENARVAGDQDPPVVAQSEASQGDTVVAKSNDDASSQAPCLFVGSKNSNKYHLPSCAVAKRIKAENRICFASKEEAERRGYVASCMTD